METRIAEVDTRFSSTWDTRSLPVGIAEPKPGYPIAVLKDHEGREITRAQARRLDSYRYGVDVYIPPIELPETVTFSLEWVIADANGASHTHSEQFLVQGTEAIDFDNVVVLANAKEYYYYIPMAIMREQIIKLEVYQHNTLVDTILPNMVVGGDSVLTVETKSDYTQLHVRRRAPKPSLDEYLINVHYTMARKENVNSYSLWSVTPSMQSIMNEFEHRVNKARLDNPVNSLNWKSADIMRAMSAGLNYLNAFKSLTSFDGTDMRGGLRMAWMICLEREALITQLKGEKDQAFSFSGQAVQFDTQRTEAIESKLQTLETELDRQLAPLKEKLAVYGIRSGSGAEGDFKNLSTRSLGTTILSNGPLTRIHRTMPSGSRNVF